MPLTFQQFKVLVRQRVFPAGEARNLRPAHDKSIVDALVDLQRWVECLQSNNTTLVPHCSTFYNCGLTSFNFPRSIIKRLSVIDKINPTTHLEDATAADDYCTEIEYLQVDGCQIRKYLGKSRTSGCCASYGDYFPIPDAWSCGKLRAPVPTDEGVLETLPSLPLGYKYPQESTNSACGRSRVGAWAKENGLIYVAPWIQSTETIVIKCDGIKREWVDSDLVSGDPGVLRAVEMFLRWEHARDWDKNLAVGAGYENEYRKALQELMYDCAQEGMVRDCGTDRHLGAGGSGRDGGMSPPRVVVGEDCVTSGGDDDPDDDGVGSTFKSTVSLSATVSCADNWTRSGDANPPTGPTVTITVSPGEEESTISTALANERAEILLQQRISRSLAGQCTFHNKSASHPVTCPDGVTTHTETVPANDSDCNSTDSQAAADGAAARKALQAAQAWLADGNCPGPQPPQRFCNIELPDRTFRFSYLHCQLSVTISCPYGVADGATQPEAQANAEALVLTTASLWYRAAQRDAAAGRGCRNDYIPAGRVWCIRT